MNQKLELHTQVVYKNQHAGEIFQHNSSLSQQHIEQCFNNGAVWLESSGKPVRLYDSKALVTPGQKLHLYCNELTLSPCPYKPELIEDLNDFSIWYKPTGMLSQGSKWGDHWTIHRWIKKNIWPDRECLIAHRLDRFTQGLIIVAHTESINRRFHRLFENREIDKTYRAIITGNMAPGEQLRLTTPIDGKMAQSDILVIENNPVKQQSLVEIKPSTGRKHQIRIHLSEIGHPILNDRQYGNPPHSGDLMLQASELEFKHPSEHRLLKFSLGPRQKLSLQNS